MAINVPRGPSLTDDAELRQIATALERYLADHPEAVIDLYRHDRYLVRIRVVDPTFAGMRLGARQERVWDYLSGLPDEVVGDVSTLLPITPDEKPDSYGSLAFDKPDPLPI